MRITKLVARPACAVGREGYARPFGQRDWRDVRAPVVCIGSGIRLSVFCLASIRTFFFLFFLSFTLLPPAQLPALPVARPWTGRSCACDGILRCTRERRARFTLARFIYPAHLYRLRGGGGEVSRPIVFQSPGVIRSGRSWLFCGRLCVRCCAGGRVGARSRDGCRGGKSPAMGSYRFFFFLIVFRRMADSTQFGPAIVR